MHYKALYKFICFIFLLYAYRYDGQFIGSRYGAGSGQIWLVRCNGRETSITNCQYRSWSRHNCTHDNDVSVSCVSGIATNSLQFAQTYCLSLR